ncbi:25S rRNA (uridine(2843)-N(3))-methyltransferase [Yarrowia sp. B02]|nr:25S rRNA (uridine(2843)-N(3))-methyltransferase [Yarrowia sp. B02]
MSESSQSVLDLFSWAFEKTLALSDDVLTERMQAVKSDLYNRDYMAAFGSQDNLDVYAVRWSPARALAYHELFKQHEVLRHDKPNVLCIGGGAGGELAALYGLIAETAQKDEIKLNMVDIANWGECVTKLEGAFPNVYDKNTNKNVVTEFVQGDILTPETVPSFEPYTCITLMFTTNELFTENKAQTIRMLNRMTEQCKSGTLLLVCESAGSYSDIQINGKTFPVHFLLDHTLARGRNATGGPWEIVDQSNSEWFRISKDLELVYPWKLEDMRYFFRLYRKV